MPTPHAQRLARARRRHTVRSLVTRALRARILRNAYVNKQVWDAALDTTDERLPWDDAPTPFLPEDWRLECVVSGDDIPEYMGRDLDGLFL